MASYKEKILEVIGESEVGLTTVDVAKKAGVSKTTVIKYLSVLSSEGSVEFVEVGPSKLWRERRAAARHGVEREKTAQPPRAEEPPAFEIDFGHGEDSRIVFTFRVDPERICSLMKRFHRCVDEKRKEKALTGGMSHAR